MLQKNIVVSLCLNQLRCRVYNIHRNLPVDKNAVTLPQKRQHILTNTCEAPTIDSVLTLYVPFCSQSEYKYMFPFYVIAPHWHDTGSWNISSCKTRTYLFSWCFITLALIAQIVRAIDVNPKVGDSSPPQVETFSVSKTLTLSQEHQFVRRKWLLLPAHS